LRQAIGQRQIVQRRLDARCRGASDRGGHLPPLVLVHERAGGDQRQVLGMIAPITRLVGAKRKLVGPRDHDRQGLQQALRVLVAPRQGGGSARCCRAR